MDCLKLQCMFVIICMEDPLLSEVSEIFWRWRLSMQWN